MPESLGGGGGKVAPAAPATRQAQAPAPTTTEPPQTVAPPLESVPVVMPAMVRNSKRVALLLPLSGASAATGQALLNAAQLALFDAGDEGFVLLPEDTGDTPEGAVRAFQAALQDNAGLILGPLFSASVTAVAPLAHEANINIIAFTNDQNVAGDGVYVIGLLPRAQIERVVSFARSKGLSRFAALVPEGPYGRTVLDGLNAAVERSEGASVVRVATYDPRSADASAAVKRLAEYDSRHGAVLAQRKALRGKEDAASRDTLKSLDKTDTMGEIGFDALLVPEGGAKLRAVATLLSYYDIDPERVKLLGSAQWDDPGIASEPALVGGWFAAAAGAKREAFEHRYQQTFNQRPPQVAGLAYDATALAAILARAPQGPNFSTAALTDSSGFEGVNGIFRLLPNGLSERGYAVYEVQPHGAKPLSPAPETFELPTQ